jgi:hypothetical protein
MHIWGDEDFDWEALDESINYIATRCVQFAWCRPYIKEKWGFINISLTCAFWGEWPIYGLVYPGYYRYHWPKWVLRYVEPPFRFIFKYTGVTWLVNKYQLAVLKFFWKRAAKKWPHIEEEILHDYDWVIRR